MSRHFAVGYQQKTDGEVFADMAEVGDEPFAAHLVNGVVRRMVPRTGMGGGVRIYYHKNI